MPVNLNALIRYKTIDSCLSNNFRECNIEYLQEKCADAITQSTGKITSISERSIRNDIRILRSDILGFNAPIKCENGIYYYSDTDYSIFNTGIEDKELLIEIQKLLVDEYSNIQNKKLPYLLSALSELTGIDLPKECYPPDHNIYSMKRPDYKPSDFDRYKTNVRAAAFKFNYSREKHLQHKTWALSLFKKKNISSSFLWNNILASLN